MNYHANFASCFKRCNKIANFITENITTLLSTSIVLFNKLKLCCYQILVYHAYYCVCHIGRCCAEQTCIK